MKVEKKFDLEERLLRFAIETVKFLESLPDTKASNYLGSQLLRSGTSPALNYGEAQAAESRKDFIHKMKIILKELRETSITLKILFEMNNTRPCFDLLGENRQLIAIFTKSIFTAESKQVP